MLAKPQTSLSRHLPYLLVGGVRTPVTIASSLWNPGVHSSDRQTRSEEEDATVNKSVGSGHVDKGDCRKGMKQRQVTEESDPESAVLLSSNPLPPLLTNQKPLSHHTSFMALSLVISVVTIQALIMDSSAD